MQKVLSTYLFVSHKLTPELLAQISENGFSALEVFCSRAHFDYGSKQEIQALASALEANRMTLSSLHAPTSRDLSATRESGTPLSICEVERVRRIEAMDELKRFSSLEHLVLHAHHAGVTLAMENTTSEMGDPAYLRSFVDETRLTGLRFNFDIGHAHLADGPAEERLEKSFAPLRELTASVHLHDNHAEKDEHLPPYDGTIDWSAAIPLLKTAPPADLPVVLELKEKFGADAPSPAEQLAAARAAFEKFENAWSA